MEHLIDKDALVAEMERWIELLMNEKSQEGVNQIDKLSLGGRIAELQEVKAFINTLEVKEVDEQKERMSECPYRQVGCTRYLGTTVFCNGACSWVVDYPKLKELKAQKGELYDTRRKTITFERPLCKVALWS